MLKLLWFRSIHMQNKFRQDGALRNKRQGLQTVPGPEQLRCVRMVRYVSRLVANRTLWDELKRRVYARAKPSTNVHRLRDAIFKECKTIQ